MKIIIAVTSDKNSNSTDSDENSYSSGKWKKL